LLCRREFGAGGDRVESRLRTLAVDLAKMTSVQASVIVAVDGTVVADTIEGDAEKEGAVAAFVGAAADLIGNTLALGTFDWGVVTMTNYRMLIVGQPQFFIGLLLSPKASPTLLAAQIQESLAQQA
jgi:predicted regulator of Ras-like GTPase activity (Roadblock/LC7/MglB family)